MMKYLRHGGGCDTFTPRMLIARLLVAFLFCMLLATHRSSSALAQPQGLFAPPAAAQQQPFTVDKYRRIPRDPLTQSAAVRAMQELNSGEVISALKSIQEILDHDADFFLTDEAGSSHSLFQDLRELLQEHHEEYERLFGTTASQLLTDARSDQNSLKLEEVVRRFTQTKAGAEALAELARIDRDRGEPGLAARSMEVLANHWGTAEPRSLLLEAARLLAANGQSQQGAALLRRHPEQFPETEAVEPLLTTAIRLVPPAQNALRYEWHTPMGDVTQTGQSNAAPVYAANVWNGELVDDNFDFPSLLVAPDVSAILAEEHRQLQDAVESRIRSTSGRVAMPAVRPLIVNNQVITHGPGSIKAFDLHTGALKWNGVDIDETFDYLAKQSYSAGEAHDPVREEMQELFASVRGWRDLTSASLSTDGRNVYAISNCQLVGTTNPQLMMQNVQRHALLPQRMNRLTAYELESEGKKLWSIGTPDAGTPGLDMLEAREIFFYGAPLPVNGRLYVIGEERGQVQVYELDPATGSVMWSLGLLNPDRDLTLDDTRRIAGLMPAYSGGLLICPTGEGMIVAVDPLRRQVVWTHLYAEVTPMLRNQVMVLRMVRPQTLNVTHTRDELLTDQRWFDSPVMIAGDTLIYTPPDSDQLICLSLQTGNPLWKISRKRGQMVYAATIIDDQLILVGKSEVQSVSLADGTPAWKSPVPIPGPSGRGIRMGNQFLQPLVSGEIGVIDLQQGRMLTRLPVTDRKIAGNLVADQGILLTQTATGLAAYQSGQQLEKQIAQLLSDNPSNVEGISLRGAWKLQQGEFDAGIQDLKQALTIDEEVPSRGILSWALLDAMRTDFVKYRDQANLIESSLGSPDQALQFLSIYARGLQRSGEFVPAFERYLQILDLVSLPEELIDRENGLAVTNSRWALARIDELLSASDETSGNQMRGLLTAWVQKAKDPNQLLMILPSIRPDWVNATAVLEKLASTQGMERLILEREAVLTAFLASADQNVRIQAAAQLLDIALRFKDAPTARRMLALIETKDVPLGATNGAKSSLELARNVRQNAESADLLHADYDWEQEIRADDKPEGSGQFGAFQIPMLGPPSAQLTGWTFFLSSGGGSIECYDQHGRHRGRIGVNFGGSRPAVESDLSRYVFTHNHLAIVVLLDRFVIIDMLTDPNQPRAIVTHEFTRAEDLLFRGANTLSGIPRAGLRSMILELRSGRAAANVGPLTNSMVCFGNNETYTAIHPVTGAELWRKQDLPAGAEILGDDDYVILKPGDEDALIVLRAMDGEFVKKVKLPAGALSCLDRRSGDWGRMLPVVEPEADKFVWKLFDPVRETAVWTMNGAVGTRFSVVSGQKVAFLTPDNKLSIRDGMTGREISLTGIPLQQPVQQIAVVEYPNQWILATSGRGKEYASTQDYFLRSHDLYLAPADGPVFAIDKATDKITWTRTVTNQKILTQGPSAWPLLIFCRPFGVIDYQVLNRLTGDVLQQRGTEDSGSGILGWLTQSNPSRVVLKFGKEQVVLWLGVTPSRPSTKASPTAPQQNE